MDAGIALVIALLLLLALLICDVPVAFSMASSGTLGLVLLTGFDVTGRALASIPYSAIASYSLVVVPMFMLMGMLTLRCGLAESLFNIASRWLGWFPGGLGLATVSACAGFAAVTGSSIATVATLGRMAITEMERHGYARYFAAGIIGASGTLGVLIPPSIALVLYGIMTGESIGRLLLAGIIPGIISALVYAVLVVVRVRRNPAIAGGTARTPKAVGADVSPAVTAPDGGVTTAAPGGRSPYWALLQIGVIFLIVVGGIYTGVFTATESGALGALAALGLVVVKFGRRPRELLRQLSASWHEAVSLSSMAFMILIGASIFSYFLVVGGIPTAVTRTLVDLPAPDVLTVALMLLLLVPLGMFLDPVSILIITVPLVHGPVTALGFDGIWLGIIYVKMIEIGLITPPVGMNAYIVAGTTPGLSVERVFKGLSPFLVADFLTVALFFALPGLVTWLPDRAGI